MNEIIKRLDRIIELLEQLADVPELPAEAFRCQHERAEDHGTMGMRLGEKMYCPDCKIFFSREENDHETEMDRS